MGNGQPAFPALFACKLGLSEAEIGLEHAFIILIAMAIDICTFTSSSLL
jgi:hypothetical protein